MSKINKQNPISQQLPAGVLANDHNIEFAGVKDSQTVIWLQRGNVHAFCDMPSDLYQKLKDKYLNDAPAVAYLSQFNFNIRRQVELFTYYMYGALDGTPDVINGELQPSENFRDTLDCVSLKWNSKTIDYKGVELKPKQIKILDFISEDLPDKAIAAELNISMKTLDYHKKALYTLLGVSNKTAAVLTAVKANIISA